MIEVDDWCTTIQGQGQGHGTSEVPQIALFKVYLLRRLQPGAGKWPPILKLGIERVQACTR